MISRTFHFIWLGGHLPEWGQGNLDTFRILNPDYEIFLWNDNNLDWLNADMKWLERVFPSKAGVSNALRLMVLKEHGGYYFDVDFRCRLPVAGLVPEGSTAVAAFQDGGRICNAFMAAEPNHPWVEWQLKNLNKYEGHNAEWGPLLATEAQRTGLTIIDSNLVYPYLYDSPEEERVSRPETIAEHQWKGTWV